ncbi:MAG: HEPN domain-containing protein [Actinobacteria bacterium]|nr:HEPN domain-containing protein [Actinomycetota bacterium]
MKNNKLTDKGKQVQLAKYRLKQSEESINEAICLLSGKGSPRSIINRAYYAMFYSVLALILFKPYTSSKHSGVLSYFNKKFIKEGILPKYIGSSINKAFELRQDCDYREYAELSYEEVEPFIEKAKIFLQKIKDYLEKNYFS